MKNKLLKRISAAFIAMCIAVSLVPAVFADGTETATDVTYTFSYETYQKTNLGEDVANYTMDETLDSYTGGKWQYLTINEKARQVADGELAYYYKDGIKTLAPNRRVRQLHTSIRITVYTTNSTTTDKDKPYYDLSADGVQLALKLQSPAKGFYRAETRGTTNVSGYKAQFYLGKFIGTGTPGIADYTSADRDFYSETSLPTQGTADLDSAAGWEAKSRVALDGIVYSDGETDLAFAIDTGAKSKYLRDLHLVPINPEISLVVDKTTLTEGEETKANVNATWTETEKTTTQKMLNSFVTYDSTNKAAATVDEDGKITAVAPGNTTITATVNGVDVYTQPISVTAPTVSFYAESNDNTNVPITIAATDADGNEVEAAKAATLDRGASVTVTAPEKEGYLFVGWFRGSKDNGRFVWADSEYTFDAMTHTMLTAVYEEAPEKAYYNFNGEFLGTEKPSSDPTMLGYEFNGWNETVYNNLTRFVANYSKDTEETYNVTLPSGVSVEKDEDDYYYDTKVTLTSDNAVTWLRNEKPVAYGTTYTFYVWNNVEITTATTPDTAPKVILDSSKSGAYMIEYDKGDADGIVEAGIIFGNDKNITINSCEEKMNSQRNEDRGQFSAKAGSYAVARGYIIYKDNGDYKVIYAD